MPSPGTSSTCRASWHSTCGLGVGITQSSMLSARGKKPSSSRFSFHRSVTVRESVSKATSPANPLSSSAPEMSAVPFLKSLPSSCSGQEKMAYLRSPLFPLVVEFHKLQVGQDIWVVEEHMGVPLSWANFGPTSADLSRRQYAKQISQQMLSRTRVGHKELLRQQIEFRVNFQFIEERITPFVAGRSMLEKPPMKGLGGSHVVLVVLGDRVEQRRVTFLEVRLVVDDRPDALVDPVMALESSQHLEGLQAIRLHANLERVGGHRHEVDEESGVAQMGEQHLGTGPEGHGSKSRPLGVVVVVDVAPGVCLPALGEERHDVRRGLRLFLETVCPAGVVNPSVIVDVPEAEEEEQARCRRPERMPFEIKVDVPRVWLRQVGIAVTPDRVVTCAASGRKAGGSTWVSPASSTWSRPVPCNVAAGTLPARGGSVNSGERSQGRDVSGLTRRTFTLNGCQRRNTSESAERQAPSQCWEYSQNSQCAARFGQGGSIFDRRCQDRPESVTQPPPIGAKLLDQRVTPPPQSPATGASAVETAR